jgi:SAM-dependent methyltransferase
MFVGTLRTAYQRVLGHPFVYNHVRPLVVGRHDRSPFYARIGGARAAILDVGCGTGDALRYLAGFESYVGFDTDPVAIEFAQKTYGRRDGVHFECGTVDAARVQRLAPTVGVLAGVLHHLSDVEAVDLLAALKASPRLNQILTLDTVYVPGKRYSNLLARLDRGRYTRVDEGYRALARSAGLQIAESEVVPSHPKNHRVVYFVMTLVPRSSP